MSTGTEQCSICDGNHVMAKFNLIRQENIPDYMKRQITQAKFFLSQVIKEMDAQGTKPSNPLAAIHNSDRPLYPRTPYIPGS